MGKREPVAEEGAVIKSEVVEEKDRKKWEDLNLVKPILRAIKELGFKHPTNI